LLGATRGKGDRIADWDPHEWLAKVEQMTDLTARWQESEFADQVQVGLGMLGLPVSSERAQEVLDRLNRFDVADDGSGEWQHIVDLLSALIRMLQGAELDEILEHAASNYLEGTFAAIANRLAEDEESGVISRAVASRGVPATAAWREATAFLEAV